MGVNAKFHGPVNLSGPRGPWQIGLNGSEFHQKLIGSINRVASNIDKKTLASNIDKAPYKRSVTSEPNVPPPPKAGQGKRHPMSERV